MNIPSLNKMSDQDVEWLTYIVIATISAITVVLAWIDDRRDKKKDQKKKEDKKK